AWCNNAKVMPRGDGSEGWQVIGDPTEGARVVAAMTSEMRSAAHDRRILLVIPSDSEPKPISAGLRPPQPARTQATTRAPRVTAGEWGEGEGGGAGVGGGGRARQAAVHRPGGGPGGGLGGRGGFAAAPRGAPPPRNTRSTAKRRCPSLG